MRSLLAAITVLLGVFVLPPVRAQVTTLPIGVIQGAAGVSPYLNRFVNFRGVVVGRYEDENTRGDVYYTLFVQSLADDRDGDPATSDGIAVFLGRQPRDDILLGATVLIGGKVTEFYGLTEMDDNGLVLTVEAASGPLPPSVLIDPPAGMAEQAVYFEALEGMRVAYEGEVIVAGPTHEGCGFAVIGGEYAAELPAVRWAEEDPAGRVVPVLYPSDRTCDDIPQVKTGDRITGMAGALTYNFDQFKIVFDSAGQLEIEPAEVPVIPPLPATGPEQITLATLNAEDYFDTTRDTVEEGEPVLTEAELVARRIKLSHAIAHSLNCPTIVALQEVEHAALLADLSAALAGPCGFDYDVSHLDSPDERGIDNALLSDARRVAIGGVTLRQTCSPVPTGIADPAITCLAGEEPLFGRPPLQVETRIDGLPYTFFVNHFKSKRGGEIETDLERVRQAVYLNALVGEMLAANPAARIVALGDFNDTDLSPAMALLTDPAQGGLLANPLLSAPSERRYTYNFGGVVEMIDAILLSPALLEEVGWATIIHSNADFPSGWRLDTSPERLPFRVSDHDATVIALGKSPATPEPATTTPVPTAPPVEPIAPPPVAAGSEAVADDRPPTAPPTAGPTTKPATDGRPPAPEPVTAGDTGYWPFLLIGVAGAVALVALLFARARR